MSRFRLSDQSVIATTLLASTVLLCLVLGSHSAVAEDWQYTVRPGDDLWTLARKHCVDKDCWREVAAYNEISNPRALRTGQRLAFPLHLLVRQPTPATLLALTGAVFLESSGGRRVPASIGIEILTGDRLWTEPAASAKVQFADGSTMLVGASAEVVFDLLASFRDSGMVDTAIRVPKGRVEPEVRRQGPASRFRVSTPTGTATVRGTSFRIRADGTVFAELTEGLLDFEQINLDAGFGVRSAPGEPISAPEALLAAPEFPSEPLAVAAPVRLSWPSVAGARGYQVLVFNDDAVPGLLTTRRSDEPQLDLPDLLPGRSYSVQVRGIADSGLEGKDGSAQLRVLPPVPAPSMTAATTSPGVFEMVWAPVDGAQAYRYQVVQVGDTGADSVIVASDTTTGTRANVDLQAGAYQWQVAAIANGVASPLSPATAVRVALTEPTLLAGERRRKAATVRWTPVAGAASYLIETASDQGFADTTMSTPVTGTELQIPLADNTQYVRVRGVTSDGTQGPPSDLLAILPPVDPKPFWLTLAGIAILALAL